MTILCLVMNTRDQSWALLSDCLITSDETSQGRSLSTPLRVNYGPKETFGFAEVALEEKIGFIEDNMILGWAGARHEAVQVIAKIQSRGSDDKLKDILKFTTNSYAVIQRKIGGDFSIGFYGQKDKVHTA